MSDRVFGVEADLMPLSGGVISSADYIAYGDAMYAAAQRWNTLGQVDRAIQCHQAAALYYGLGTAMQGPPGPPGATGATGPPGPTAVSHDARNIAILGTDNLLYVGDNYLPTAGGTLTGAVRFNSNVGFNSTAPIGKPTVSGACAGNTAIKALLTALANYGLITDSTTA